MAIRKKKWWLCKGTDSPHWVTAPSRSKALSRCRRYVTVKRGKVGYELGYRPRKR